MEAITYMMRLTVELGVLYTLLHLTRIAANFWWNAEKVPPISMGDCCIFAGALLLRNRSMRNGLWLLVPRPALRNRSIPSLHPRMVESWRIRPVLPPTRHN